MCGLVGILAANPDIFDIISISARDRPGPTDKGGFDAIPLLPWLLFILF